MLHRVGAHLAFDRLSQRRDPREWEKSALWGRTELLLQNVELYYRTQLISSPDAVILARKNNVRLHPPKKYPLFSIFQKNHFLCAILN